MCKIIVAISFFAFVSAAHGATKEERLAALESIALYEPSDMVDEEEVILLSTDRIIGSYTEGSVIYENDEGYYVVDENEESKRREENFALAESLFDE